MNRRRASYLPEGSTTGKARAIIDGPDPVDGWPAVPSTDQHDAHAGTAAAHARFAALIEHSSDVICVLDGDGRVRYASPAYRPVFGEHPMERIGRPLADRLHPADRPKLHRALADAGRQPEAPVALDCRILRDDGSVGSLEMTVADHLADSSVAGIIINSRDVTDRVELADRLAHEALHDPLTGLVNRALLADRIQQVVARAARDPRRAAALLLVDFDKFTPIDDLPGGAASHDLLVMVADHLLSAVRTSDTVARLDGDEFVVLAEDVTDVGQATIIADRVRDAVRQAITLSGHRVSTDCSIRVSLTGYGQAAGSLLDADPARRWAKERGQGRPEALDRIRQAGADQPLAIEAMLNAALAAGQVRVHYQPIVSLPTGQTVGHEALARLAGESRALIMPNRFIPVAEETGLIVPFGIRVLRAACEQQARWRRRAVGTGPRQIAVNLSGRQLSSPTLLDDVDAALADYGLLPEELCLELTESTLIDADSSAKKTIRQLAGRGIAIALDDFGTGWSSLTNLRLLPVSIVKIDCRFTAGLGKNRGDTELVKAVIDLGRSLGLDVVAEGVETAAQASILLDMGCEKAQGFYLGRPRAVRAGRAAPRDPD